jgi:hypothetical protein
MSPSVRVPASAECIGIRQSQMGEVEAVFVVEDRDADEAAKVVDLTIVTEDEGDRRGGPIAGWRFVGGWTYHSGRRAHGFARDRVPAKGRKGAAT